VTWVFCAGMIRSGSTIQFQLTSAIVERAEIGLRVKYAPESEFEKIKEQFPNKERKLMVFKAHVCTSVLAQECLDERALVVYSYRDIRDVAVSAIRKFGMNFDQLTDANWLDQAIADYYKWNALPSVLVSRYEEMYDNEVGEAKKINDYLGVPLQPPIVEALARDYSIDEQKRRVEHVRVRHGSHISRGEIVFDPRELLHHNHIHAGEIGGWRRLLSPEQRAVLTDKYSDWLIETGYDLE
jgi:hypothetical protein